VSEARVVHADDVERRNVDGVAIRVLISPDSGSEQLLQRTVEIRPRTTLQLGQGNADDVLYVVEGRGVIRSSVGDVECAVATGTALLVQDHAPVTLESTGQQRLVAASVLSPPPFEGIWYSFARLVQPVVLHEDDQESLSAGEDRTFKLLIGPEHGARNITQFVGFIERSKASPHTHVYEEAIYILEGEGLVHVGEDRHEPIRPGTSIFLPPGTPHCLENRSEETLKLLGVFSPPGSPAAKREE